MHQSNPFPRTKISNQPGSSLVSFIKSSTLQVIAGGGGFIAYGVALRILTSQENLSNALSTALALLTSATVHFVFMKSWVFPQVSNHYSMVLRYLTMLLIYGLVTLVMAFALDSLTVLDNFNSGILASLAGTLVSFWLARYWVFRNLEKRD